MKRIKEINNFCQIYVNFYFSLHLTIQRIYPERFKFLTVKLDLVGATSLVHISEECYLLTYSLKKVDFYCFEAFNEA